MVEFAVAIAGVGVPLAVSIAIYAFTAFCVELTSWARKFDVRTRLGVWTYAVASGLLPDKKTWADSSIYALVTLAGVGIPDSSSRTSRNYFFAYALAVLGIPIVKLVANLDLPAYAFAFSFVPLFVVRAVLNHCTDALAV